MAASTVDPSGAAARLATSPGVVPSVQEVPSLLTRTAPSKPTTPAGAAVSAWKSDSPPRDSTFQLRPPSRVSISPTGWGRSTPLPGWPEA
ncbi:hypothetical protein ASG96_19045 [Terrabacter sp. Soil810]|nr:hypothetical protein ASG96_19045 [Terrabacter sp. Soil810]